MSKGLMVASLASGFGQGLAQAAGTGLQVYGAMMLQQQRERMEDLRMQRMEQAAAARDARHFAQQTSMQDDAQDFQRGQQQERMGFDITMRSQDAQRAEEREQRGQDFQRGLEQERRGGSVVERSLDRQAHKEERDATIGFQRDKLASDERQHSETLAAQKAHWKAMEAHAKQQYGEKVKDILVDPKTNRVYALMEGGQTKPIMDAQGEQLTGQPKFSKQDEILAHGMQEEMKDLRKELADPMTDPKRAAEIRSTLREKESTYRTVLGRGNEGASSSQMARMVDPFAGSSPMMAAGKPPSPKTQDEPAAPKPRAERTIPAMPSSPSSSPSDALSYGMDRAKEGLSSAADTLTGALIPNSLSQSHPIAKESRGEAMAAIKGNTDTLLAEKRAETQERVAASKPQAEQPAEQPAPKKRGMSVIDAANASVPPPAKQESRTSGMEWAQSLAPDDQQRLRQIISDYQAGKRNRDEFISGIISLSDNGTQGLAIAEGMLRNLDKKGS